MKAAGWMRQRAGRKRHDANGTVHGHEVLGNHGLGSREGHRHEADGVVLCAPVRARSERFAGRSARKDGRPHGNGSAAPSRYRPRAGGHDVVGERLCRHTEALLGIHRFGQRLERHRHWMQKARGEAKGHDRDSCGHEQLGKRETRAGADAYHATLDRMLARRTRAPASPHRRAPARVRHGDTATWMARRFASDGSGVTDHRRT